MVVLITELTRLHFVTPHGAKLKIPSESTLLGRTFEEVFIIFISSIHFIFGLHFFVISFLILILLSFIDGNVLFDIIPHLPVDFSQAFTPILYFYLSPICDLRYFYLNFCGIFLPRVLRFWVGVFYPQAFFTLRSFTNIFDSTCVYQGLSGSRQFFLKVCRASYWSSKYRPGSSACLIHGSSQKFYTFKLYLRVTASYETWRVSFTGFEFISW